MLMCEQSSLKLNCNYDLRSSDFDVADVLPTLRCTQQSGPQMFAFWFFWTWYPGWTWAGDSVYWQSMPSPSASVSTPSEVWVSSPTWSTFINVCSKRFKWQNLQCPMIGERCGWGEVPLSNQTLRFISVSMKCLEDKVRHEFTLRARTLVCTLPFKTMEVSCGLLFFLTMQIFLQSVISFYKYIYTLFFYHIQMVFSHYGTFCETLLNFIWTKKKKKSTGTF